MMKRFGMGRLLVFCCGLSAQILYANPDPFPTLAPMLGRIMPSIVNVSVQGVIPADNLPVEHSEKGTLPPKPKKFEAIGSGVVFDGHKGYVITNAHVIKNANIVTVTTHEGRRLLAKVIGADDDTDIAVLQVNRNDLTPLTMGNSLHVHVGDFVIAIGNPYGLNSFGRNQTATFGIISALGRNTLNLEGVEDFIQTDAAINPGNSGGALVTTSGELIGINTAILTPFGGNIGIGFAIPVNMTKIVVDQLIRYGKVNRGLMGVFVQQFTPELAEAFGLTTNTSGALVTQVNRGSSADKAGLKTGDVITQINNTRILDSAQVKTFVGLLRVGMPIRVKVIRDKKPLTLSATVNSISQQENVLQQLNPYLHGLALSEFHQTNPLQGQVSGVQVMGTSEQSSAYRAGIRPGDVIDKANGHPIKAIETLMNVAKATPHGHGLLLHVLRGNGALYVVITPA